MIIQYEIYQDDNNLPFIKPIIIFDSELAQQMQEMSCEYIDIKIDVMRQFFQMQNFESEHMYVIASDSDGKIKGIYLIGIGNQREVNLNTRNMFIFLLLIGAYSCLIIHNHPNNDLHSSQDDKTCSLIYASELKVFNIKYEGSYIIGKSGFSNCDTGEITKWESIDYNKEPDFSVGEWEIVLKEGIK